MDPQEIRRRQVQVERDLRQPSRPGAEKRVRRVPEEAAGRGPEKVVRYNAIVSVAKTLLKVLNGASDAAIRFEDLCTLLDSLGFERRECQMSKYEIIIYWSEEDEAFVAEVPELPGCSA